MSIIKIAKPYKLSINYKPLIVLVLISLPLISLAQKGNKYYVSFLKEDNRILFHVKPLNLSNENGNDLHMDLTFLKDSFLTVNYSLFEVEKMEEIDSVVIKNNLCCLKLSNNKLLFNEKHKKLIESRFSSSAPIELVQKLFKDGQWHVEVYTDTKKKKYSYTKQFKRRIHLIDESLFSVY